MGSAVTFNLIRQTNLLFLAAVTCQQSTAATFGAIAFATDSTSSNDNNPPNVSTTAKFDANNTGYVTSPIFEVSNLAAGSHTVRLVGETLVGGTLNMGGGGMYVFQLGT